MMRAVGVRRLEGGKGGGGGIVALPLSLARVRGSLHVLAPISLSLLSLLDWQSLLPPPALILKA